MALTRLEGIAEGLIRDSLAMSSQKAYRSAQNVFLQFCSSLQLPALPTSEQVLLLFIADLSQRVCQGTARSYLAAIRHLHLASGLPDPLTHAPRIGLALKGLKRRRPKGADARLPITPLILQKIGSSLVQFNDQYEQLLVWAACCLRFFAFMRSGELTVPAGSTFDPTMHLTPMDVAADNLLYPSMLKIRLKSSKTDQARAGVDVYTGRTYNCLCPVVAMLRYLAARGFDNGPWLSTHQTSTSREGAPGLIQGRDGPVTLCRSLL